MQRRIELWNFTRQLTEDAAYVILLMRQVLDGVPKNLTVKDVDAMTFISDPVQKESYQVAVPKQYRMLLDAGAVIIPLMKKKVDILNPRDLSDLNCYATI